MLELERVEEWIRSRTRSRGTNTRFSSISAKVRRGDRGLRTWDA